MQVNLNNPLTWETPAPKYALPLTITGALATTAAVVTVIALSIIGVAVFPLVLPIAAAVVIGGTLCASVAGSILNKHRKPANIKAFEYALACDDFFKAEEILRKIPTDKDYLAVLYCRLASRLHEKEDHFSAAGMMHDKKRITTEVRHVFLQQLIEKYRATKPIEYMERLIKDYTRELFVENAFRHELAKFYFLEKRFADACRASDDDSSPSVVLNKILLETIESDQRQPWVAEVDSYLRKKAIDDLQYFSENYDSDGFFVLDKSYMLNKSAENMVDSHSSQAIVAHLHSGDYSEDFKEGVVLAAAKIYLAREQFGNCLDMLNQVSDPIQEMIDDFRKVFYGLSDEKRLMAFQAFPKHIQKLWLKG